MSRRRELERRRGTLCACQRLLAVQAHTARHDPSSLESIDMVLGLLHADLTSQDARRSITTRLHRTAAAAEAPAGSRAHAP